jgi:hypothetical protein
MAEETVDAVEQEEIEEPAADATPDENVDVDPTPAGEDDDIETKVLLSDDEDDGAEGVPNKYEFVSPDDIGDIEMTDEVKAQFDAFDVRAKEAGLSQDQYQKIVEGEIRRGRAAMTKMVTDYQQRVETWADVTKEDKELGGDDLSESLSVAKLGLDTFGSPELKRLFAMPSKENPEGLGIGSHPEVIRLLHRVGLQVKEDGSLIEGDGGQAAADDAALRRMYPSMFKEEAAA